MKKSFKKLLAAGLAVLTALSLAACGSDINGDKGSSTDTQKGEFVYVPEYVSIGGGENERVSLSGAVYADGKLYYNSYIYDEASGTSREPLFRYDISTGSAEELNLDQEAWQDAYLQNMAVDKEGSLYVTLGRTIWDENNPDNWQREFMLAKYDASGSTVFFKDITEELLSDEENNYVQNMAVDDEGRIYLVFSELIRLYDSEGSYMGNVETGDNWIDSAFRGKDGKVYIAYYDWNSGDRSYVAVDVDFNGKKLGTVHQISGNVSELAAGLEKDFLISDRTRLYEYDMENDTQEELLNWMDCDINGEYVELMCASEDGRLMVVTRDWGTGETEIIFLTKTRASEVVQKEELVIGTFYMSQELRTAAVNFNKSSEKYHITVREYYDYNSDIEYSDAVTNMNNEIISGNCPDILALDSNGMDVDQLVEKGVLADLNPFLDSSSTLSRDSFVESVLRGYTYGDALVGIPKTFEISSVAGKTSQVGKEMGWSVQDIMAFAAEHPDAELFEYASRSEMMQILMIFNQDAFIDWEKGTCNFDSEEFKQILEFVASFPEEYNWDGERVSTPTKLATGKLLLYTDSIDDCRDIQVAEAMFNEPVTYIGFPTIDGGVGCVMNCSASYGITAKSGHKEGAWEFIESYLNTESGMFSWGFPSRKDKLEEAIAEAMKVEYATDMDGEILTDEDGNPIVLGMGGFGYDDWQYTYHPCTEEEMATLRQLIDVAIPLSLGDSKILEIINEEAEPFYQGQKSLEDVVSIIQSKISMYVGENS